MGRLVRDLVISIHCRTAAHLRPLAPGATERLRLTLPAGTYLLASTELSDQPLGIFRTLTVS